MIYNLLIIILIYINSYRYRKFSIQRCKDIFDFLEILKALVYPSQRTGKFFFFLRFYKGVSLPSDRVVKNQIFRGDFLPTERIDFVDYRCFPSVSPSKYISISVECACARKNSSTTYERANWRQRSFNGGDSIGMTTLVNYDGWTPCNRGAAFHRVAIKGESSGFILKRPFDSLWKAEFRSFRYIYTHEYELNENRRKIILMNKISRVFRKFS